MPKFLIVDDDLACRRLAQHFLSPYGRCDLAYDGKEALCAIRMHLEAGEPYDLICLDIMMPDMDGHEVLDAIRRLESERGICGSDRVKVVMASALTDSKHCIRAFREGCESYVTKPLSEERFLAQVRELLGELPCAKHPSATADPVSTPAEPAACEPPPTPRSRLRYLIVDDDRVCRELLKDMLSRYGECDFAYDGFEAVDAVRLALDDGDGYHLVCLDIMMPGSSGHAALEAIRQLETERGIHGGDVVPVIMTTALSDSKHCIRAFREGCECYVTKPIHEQDLLDKMRQLGVLESKRAVEVSA